MCEVLASLALREERDQRLHGKNCAESFSILEAQRSLNFSHSLCRRLLLRMHWIYKGEAKDECGEGINANPVRTV